ncbi:hypothetical protein NQ176_g9404 [Zarea fungicola]|uniref:Uncharacterized protein n=1 Tax=Zarea fungicola TaxID=93591 RepID=A0ACC1MMW6_9HYPO|nr:hypothetical protein NQ176_g9404 [Lecanicillium fungicola]
MERSQAASSNLMETHNRHIAGILTHYRTLMMLATVQAEGEQENATPEAIAVAGISMKMEFDGLVRTHPHVSQPERTSAFYENY